MDANRWAVFVHAVGDAFYSLVVGGIGVTVRFLAPRGAAWVDYLDPGATLLLCVLMALSMRGVIARCIDVLLERSIPKEELGTLRWAITQVRVLVSSCPRVPVPHARRKL